MRNLITFLVLFVLIATPAFAQLECKFKVSQDGDEVSATTTGKTINYKLKANSFKVEVSPAECEPTMALVTQHHLEYILQTPLVFSPSGVFMAGSPDEIDILGNQGGDNPRTTLSEILSSTNESAWAKQEYDSFCESLKYCPTPTLAFSTAWPFLDPTTKEFRGFAEFKRFTKFRPMSGASGKVLLAVVYTRWKISTKGHSAFYVLKPNALIFDFR